MIILVVKLLFFFTFLDSIAGTYISNSSPAWGLIMLMSGLPSLYWMWSIWK